MSRRPSPMTLAVAVLGTVFALFFLLPFVGLVWRAIDDPRAREALGDPSVATALRISMLTTSVSVTLSLLFGTPAAYLLARRQVPGGAVLDALLDLPIVLPPTVAGVALLTAFGRRGLLGEPIEALTGLALPFTMLAVIVAQTFVAAPLYVRAARAGFEAVDPELEAIARTLGASRAHVFRRITLPLARGPLLAGLVLCWARALGELGATLIFAGSLVGRTQTLPLAVVAAFEGGPLGLPGAVALSLLLLATAVALLAVLRLAAKRGLT
ncbi:MAG: molybdate ABC transporter permease subunit [Dehalococcoidia bacterium]|nr:MAG: molybdate ABC transporter permease subunit [Dehalococcoidia bacterium]